MRAFSFTGRTVRDGRSTPSRRAQQIKRFTGTHSLLFIPNGPPPDAAPFLRKVLRLCTSPTPNPMRYHLSGLVSPPSHQSRVRRKWVLGCISIAARCFDSPPLWRRLLLEGLPQSRTSKLTGLRGRRRAEKKEPRDPPLSLSLPLSGRPTTCAQLFVSFYPLTKMQG